MSNLTEIELRVLRHLGGAAEPGLCWGAAMSCAVESLMGRGLVRQRHLASGISYYLTPAGLRAIMEAQSCAV